MNNFFSNLYEDLFNDFINTPLSSFTRSSSQTSDALRINQQVVNRVYNVRRQIETMSLQQRRMNLHARYPNTGNFYLNESYLDPYPFNYHYNIDQNTHTDTNIHINNNDQTNNQRNGLPNRDLDNTFFQTPLLNNLLDIVFDVYTDTIPSDLEDVKVFLSEEEFNKFEKNTIIDSDIDKYNEDSCNICLVNYKQSDTIVHLPCKHYFHNNCIYTWLCKENINCPVCRTDCRNTIKTEK